MFVDTGERNIRQAYVPIHTATYGSCGQTLWYAGSLVWGLFLQCCDVSFNIITCCRQFKRRHETPYNTEKSVQTFVDSAEDEYVLQSGSTILT